MRKGRKTFMQEAIEKKQRRNSICSSYRFGGAIGGIRICRSCGHKASNH